MEKCRRRRQREYPGWIAPQHGLFLADARPLGFALFDPVVAAAVEGLEPLSRQQEQWRTLQKLFAGGIAQAYLVKPGAAAPRLVYATEHQEEVKLAIERSNGHVLAMGNPTTTLEELFLKIIRESEEHPGRRVRGVAERT